MVSHSSENPTFHFYFLEFMSFWSSTFNGVSVRGQLNYSPKGVAVSLAGLGLLLLADRRKPETDGSGSLMVGIKSPLIFIFSVPEVGDFN